MSLTGALQFGMRQAAEVENLMTSVERVTEFANIESEANLTKKETDEILFEEKKSKSMSMFKRFF